MKRAGISVLLVTTTALVLLAFEPSRQWILHVFAGLTSRDFVEYPDAPLLSAAEQLASFTVHPDYKVELFASEERFSLHSPTDMSFDAQGRLWVSIAPDYPQATEEHAAGRIIVLEDKDSNGKADTETVFASNLRMPMGVALIEGGAYVAQAPELILLTDTDGDDVADAKSSVLDGFDARHVQDVVSNLEWGPDGALYFLEGAKADSHIETPLGLRQLNNGGVWRFHPALNQLDIVASYPLLNPTGLQFDQWGQGYVCDGGSGGVHSLSFLSAQRHYPEPSKKVIEKQPYKASIVPGKFLASCLLAQRQWLVNDHSMGLLVAQFGWVGTAIGKTFSGIRMLGMEQTQTDITKGETDEVLLASGDSNFRPVDMTFGPDGALYVLDFYSPILSVGVFDKLDPRRDRQRGRIWRVTKSSVTGSGNNPLIETTKNGLLQDRSIPGALLGLTSKLPEVRQQSRRILQQSDEPEVLAALGPWLKRYTTEQQLLDALWVYHGIGTLQVELLNKALVSPNARVRSAAARLLRFHLQDVARPLSKIRLLVNDTDARVRLEGQLTAGFLPSEKAAGLALLSANYEMSTGMAYALDRTLKALAVYGKPSLQGIDDGKDQSLRLEAVTSTELLEMGDSDAVMYEVMRRESIPVNERLLRLDTTRQRLQWFAQLPADNSIAPFLLRELANVPDSELKDLHRKVRSWKAHSRDEFRWLEAAVSFRLATAHAASSNIEFNAALDAIQVGDLAQVINLFHQRYRTPRLTAALQRYAASLTAVTADEAVLIDQLLGPNTPANIRDVVLSYARGAGVYQQYCSECHQSDAMGLGDYYPNLSWSTQLLGSPQEAINSLLHSDHTECVDEHCQESPQSVRFPFAPTDIAAVLNYLRYEFTHSLPLITESDVNLHCDTTLSSAPGANGLCAGINRK